MAIGPAAKPEHYEKWATETPFKPRAMWNEATEAELAAEWSEYRSAELQAALPEDRRGRITMGAGVVVDEHGNRHKVISSSEPNGYIRKEVLAELKDDETPAQQRGKEHAEVRIADYGEAVGMTVESVGAGRPMCDPCRDTMIDRDINPTTPFKNPLPGTPATPTQRSGLSPPPGTQPNHRPNQGGPRRG
ncbi:hypothetical protein [Fodinicola acaciae]|uniref:hypothetical protein n=1 Tax=Fodinicola acaciae TaxID=2681555 RepID=UPI0013D12485|nr:hypothetical protein [Fodinicola acaciae]